MTEELPKTRAEARELGSKRYFTGEPCKHGHIAERDTKEGKCVECVNTRNRSRHATMGHVYNANRRARRAEDPEIAKLERERAKAYYHANTEARKAYIQGWRKRNPEKHKEYGRAYHRRYPAKTKAYTKAWRAANPEQRRAQIAVRRTRLLSAEGTHDKDDIKALMKKQRGKCAICFKRLPKNYHVDHIIPLARGGSNWPSNLQLTCPPCNTQKNAKDPYDFMRSRGFLL